MNMYTVTTVPTFVILYLVSFQNTHTLHTATFISSFYCMSFQFVNCIYEPIYIYIYGLLFPCFLSDSIVYVLFYTLVFSLKNKRVMEDKCGKYSKMLIVLQNLEGRDSGVHCKILSNLLWFENFHDQILKLKICFGDLSRAVYRSCFCSFFIATQNSII